MGISHLEYKGEVNPYTWKYVLARKYYSKKIINLEELKNKRMPKKVKDTGVDIMVYDWGLIGPRPKQATEILTGKFINVVYLGDILESGISITPLRGEFIIVYDQNIHPTQEQLSEYENLNRNAPELSKFKPIKTKSLGGK